MSYMPTPTLPTASEYGITPQSATSAPSGGGWQKMLMDKLLKSGQQPQGQGIKMDPLNLNTANTGWQNQLMGRG